ncbi:hypothetical protein KIH39_12400 [Telmatocola sphagniphila]|uniref:Uncharacterized protein n=1 Tax=Telmatocola sphagniphila TaxID=1123043 RepID=A0A8E6EV96_9BACT|nr:hypothetical protein [Telmatocola sphagniphila]QVL34669.1 hypothetical protein KIH39_12400 [Telmatocola sphagniphila]
MAAVDLKRYLFAENDLRSLLSPSLAPYLSRFEEYFSLLKTLPSDQRGDFLFLEETRVGYPMVFGSGLNDCEKLAVWLIERCPGMEWIDPFFWMREYKIFSVSPSELLIVELPQFLPVRKVEDVRNRFKNGDGPFLLGASQALVDGSRIVIPREKPDREILENLWSFLPYSARSLSYVSFSKSETNHSVHVRVLPLTEAANSPGFLTEDQCRDYPPSQFEQQLQYALDYSDQKLFDRLMCRRSSRETLKMAWLMLIVALVVMVASRILVPGR